MKLKSLARSEGLCGRTLNSKYTQWCQRNSPICCHLCRSQASAMGLALEVLHTHHSVFAIAESTVVEPFVCKMGIAFAIYDLWSCKHNTIWRQLKVKVQTCPLCMHSLLTNVFAKQVHAINSHKRRLVAMAMSSSKYWLGIKGQSIVWKKLVKS